MKKKWGPLALVLSIAVLVVASIVPLRIFLAYQSFRPLETGLVEPGLHAVRDDFVNLFVLEKEGQYLVIDAGVNPDKVRAGFTQLGIDPARVGTVLLTHSDYDHAGGASLFSNARVFLPEAEVPLVNGTVRRTLLTGNRIDSPWAAMPGGTETMIGPWSVKSILVPGHTPGSTWYLVDGRYLFTGDSLGLDKGHMSGQMEVFHMDVELNRRNLGVLETLRHVELVLTAHSGLWRNEGTWLLP